MYARTSEATSLLRDLGRTKPGDVTLADGTDSAVLRGMECPHVDIAEEKSLFAKQSENTAERLDIHPPGPAQLHAFHP